MFDTWKPPKTMGKAQPFLLRGTVTHQRNGPPTEHSNIPRRTHNNSTWSTMLALSRTKRSKTKACLVVLDMWSPRMHRPSVFFFFPVKRELISCKIYIFMELINHWPYFILIIDSLINASVQVMITALWNYKQALIN